MPFLLSFGVLLSSGSPIDLDGSFFVQLFIFFVAFLILRSLVFRPVMALFDARAQAMQGARTQASEMERGADEKREHLESELRRVRQKASEHRNELRGKAQQLARELTDRARRENSAALQSAKAQLDVEARDAQAKARAEAPTIARQIAERLLGRSVS
jgi:F-type H+-transporting ATPase subunit b